MDIFLEESVNSLLLHQLLKIRDWMSRESLLTSPSHAGGRWMASAWVASPPASRFFREPGQGSRARLCYWHRSIGDYLQDMT